MRTFAGIAICGLALAGLAAGAAAQDQTRSPRPEPGPPAGAASPRDLAAWLPASTLACVDLTDGEALVERVRALLGRARPTGDVRLGLTLAPWLLRAATGLGPDDLAATVAPGQLVFAVVPVDRRPEPLLLARVGEPTPQLRGLLERLEDSVPAEIEDGVLRIARTRELLRRYRELAAGDAPRLADREGFFAGRPTADPGRSVRLFVDVDALRRRGDAESLWSRLDAGARFLFGPIARLLDRAARFDAVLEVGERELELRGRFDATVLDVDDEQVAPARAVLAAEDAEYAVPPEPPGTLFRLTLDRSLRGFWNNLGQVVSEDDAVSAQSFLSIADTLLGGASFVEDFLPALGEPWTLFGVASDRSLGEQRSRHAIDLPSFVLVAPLRDSRGAELTSRLFRTVAQISFFERAQRGELPFVLRKRRDASLRRTSWIAEPVEWRGPDPAPTAAQLQPTLTWTQGHAILATTRDGAERAVGALREGTASEGRGDELVVDPKLCADYLARNQNVLLLNPVLEDGKTLRAAEIEQRRLREAISMFRSLRIRLWPRTDRTDLTIRAEVGR